MGYPVLGGNSILCRGETESIVGGGEGGPAYSAEVRLSQLPLARNGTLSPVQPGVGSEAGSIHTTLSISIT